ncbi:MAG: hypothetical protein OXU73_02965 [Candidatus Campbellbacteria bacterium]|nr:hypothetical protein [Candidatus Campbellbacteria bacterium]
MGKNQNPFEKRVNELTKEVQWMKEEIRQVNETLANFRGELDKLVTTMRANRDVGENAFHRKLEEEAKKKIVAALKQTKWDVAKTAKLVGLSRRSLEWRMRKLKLA